MSNRLVVVDGELITLTDLARQFGMWAMVWLAGESINRLFWSVLTTAVFFVIGYVFLRTLNGWSTGKISPARPLTAFWKRVNLPYWDGDITWDYEIPAELVRAYLTILFPGLTSLIYAGLSYNSSNFVIMGISVVFAIVYHFIWVLPYALGYGWGYTTASILSFFLFLWSILDVVNLTPYRIWESFVDMKTQLVISYQALSELASSGSSSFSNSIFLWSAYIVIKVIDLFFAVMNFSIFTLFGSVLRSIGWLCGYAESVLIGSFFYILAFFTLLILVILVIQSLRAAHLVAKRNLPDGYGTFWSFVFWWPVISSFFVALGMCPPIRQLLKEQLSYSASRPYLFAFTVLALFKAVKIIVHVFSYNYLAKPTETPITPNLTPRHVTVIVETTGDDFGKDFKQSIQSILNNYPGEIVVCVNGSREKLARALGVVKTLNPAAPNLRVTGMQYPNRRKDLITMFNKVGTPITCLTNDQVFWPSGFLRSSLAEFEDPIVGLVGTAKRVIRDRSGGIISSFRNYLASIYLERQNFENTASYHIDGGVSVISDTTALFLTKIIQRFEFRNTFMNETWAWGTIGPLAADADNFITRFFINHGFKTVFRNEKHAVVTTTFGLQDGSNKFSDLLVRWARAGWRSNSTSLFADHTCWRATPWTTYAFFISSFFNLALIYDPLLAYTLYLATGREYLGIFFLLLLLSKLIKPFPHIRRNPRDIFFLPWGIVFGYYHSFIKIKALLTLYNVAEKKYIYS